MSPLRCADRAPLRRTLCALVVVLAACNAPVEPSAQSASSALLSCDEDDDCTPIGPVGPSVSCVSYGCSNHVCTPTATSDCCTKDKDCDDKNPCTADSCAIVVLSGGLASHQCEYDAAGDGNATDACCGVDTDCAAPNACQVRSCTRFSCTYTAKRATTTANSTCCDGDDDCAGGSTCNRTTNTCACSDGKILCAGTAGAETCNSVCCADSDCKLANASGTCSADSCAIKLCTACYTDCNHMDSDGCEKHTDADVNNCGTCDNVCTGQNSCEINVCAKGACGYAKIATTDAGCCNFASDCGATTSCMLNTCVRHTCSSKPDPACGDMASAPADLTSSLADLTTTSPADLTTTSVDLTAADLTAALDQSVVTVDLTVNVDDLVVPPLADLAATDDLLALGDLPPPDLRGEPDDVGVADLLVASDLSARDLARPADLQPRLSATGGSFGCAAGSGGTGDGGGGNGIIMMLAVGSLWLARRRQLGEGES